MRATLIEVGRSKVNETIEIEGKDPLAEAEKRCRKYLMSSDVELYDIPENPLRFEVVVGGMRTVGHVEFDQPVHPSPL